MLPAFSQNSTELSTGADNSEGPPLPLLPPQPDWEHSDPFFTARSRELIQRVLKCYLRQGIVFLGIPCNAVCCVVFCQESSEALHCTALTFFRPCLLDKWNLVEPIPLQIQDACWQGLSDKINLLLFWLSVTDLINLTAQLWLMPGCYLKDTVHLRNLALLVNTKLGYINWWISYSSAILLQIVSVDRCLSVVLPFKAKTVLTYRVAVAAIVLAYLFPLIGYLPMLLAFTVRWRVDPSTNRSVAYVVNTDWFPMNAQSAASFLNQFALIVVPIFLLLTIVCCSVTVVFLRRASRHRQRMVGSESVEGDSRDTRITKMLLFLCLVYVVLALPSTCSNFVTNAVPEYYVFGKYHNTFTVVFQFLWIAACLNSAVNFFVYFLLSSRFRKTLKESCGCLKFWGRK